jgi:hypothetical protein
VVRAAPFALLRSNNVLLPTRLRGILLLAFATATTEMALAQSGNGYSFARSIAIAHAQVPNTDQSNFPVLFNTTDALLKTVANGGHVQNANGYDIIFTSDAAGTVKLNHEIEYYSPSTGQFVAWVRVPNRIAHPAGHGDLPVLRKPQRLGQPREHTRGLGQ